MIVGVAPDTGELVIDAYDGRELWTGAPGERLVSVDDRFALVRSADDRSLYAAELGGREGWDRSVHEDARASLARYAAVILDERPERLIAVDPADGADLVNVRSTAEVLAVGPEGMIISKGRELAYLRFAGTVPQPTSEPGPGDPDNPGGAEPDPGPECGGPKQEQCPAG